ncbi:PREDICTED: uncharacterized protein LOC107065543 isoform X2 [Polistes dominula]|uniref:Uncharacterized protein LOC107065543 isoform X2 n=1 Tax=Polistes dominula TaxID=743375 RepID=A0ABM1I3P9_POLDO|nr:PREDICTED: uncharacterized protein LOC107065543 isoform X2 [Polistes dominula]
MNDVKDCMNNEFENDHSKELCAWIESIPFSKPKKNLSPLSLYRDFSDGVLLAEILKVYYPRYVDLHNYISANNYFLKKENWNTLNRKVLTKIDVKLNKDVVSQLVNGHQESIEKLLFEIRSKVDKIDQRDVLPLSATPNSEQSKLYKLIYCRFFFIIIPINHILIDNRDDVKQPVNMNDDNCIETLTSENKNIQELAAPSHLTISYIKDAIFYAAIWLFSWFCFWNFFMNYRIKNNINENKAIEVDQEDEHVPRQICIQLKQELREKDNLICTLNHQIAYLEGAMKLKDLRISSLMSKINCNSYSH